MEKIEKNQYEKIKVIFKKYKLENKDMRYIWKVIQPIFCHTEFQKRMKPPFYHHSDITVGEHIISDTILVYKLCKKRKEPKEVIRRALLIAMFHDLYDKPWMNDTPKEHFINYHAFTHPIEAIVNAITWFPEYFANYNDSKIIIDGVLHHMYPCPVRAASSLAWELHDISKYEALEDKYKRLITCSLKPCIFKNLSLRNTFYIEGRLLVKIDKIVTMRKDLKGQKVLQGIKSMASVFGTALTK